MAKRKTSSTDNQRTKGRRPVVKDERLLAPVFADYSMLVVGANVVIHSLFQTEIPVTDLSVSGPVDSVLVGRFVYPADFFRALTVMFARQFIAFEAGRGNGEKEFNWLQQELKKQAEKVGIVRQIQGQ